MQSKPSKKSGMCSWIGENSFFDAFVLIGRPAIVRSASFKTKKEAQAFLARESRNEQFSLERIRDEAHDTP